MNFNTAGELIKILSQFDPATPVLKGDFSGCYYDNIRDIALVGKMLYRVKPVYGPEINAENGNHYDDAVGEAPGSFDAIVL